MHTKKIYAIASNKSDAKKKTEVSNSKTKSDGSKQVIRKKLNDFDYADLF